MNSQDIVAKWNLNPDYSLLWEDFDHTLSQTPFKTTGDDDFDKKTLSYWLMNIYNIYNTNYEVYKSYTANLNKLFKYVINSGIAKSNQINLNLICYKSDSVEDHRKELDYFLPYIKLIDHQENPVKILGLLENTLCKKGIYNLFIYNDNKTELGITRYNCYDKIILFDTLNSAISYCKSRHYYKKK